MPSGTLRILAAAALFFAAAPSPAAGAAAEAPALLASGPGRLPKPGEWLEYRVAFLLDPLEHSLAGNPAGGGGGEKQPEGLSGDWLPAFEQPRIWRTLPLRLEVLAMGRDSCRARMTFAESVGEVDIPLAGGGGAAEWAAAAPPPTGTKTPHRLWDRVLEAERTSESGDGHGFVRLTHPEAPFGLLRFAAADLDLILVGFGEGVPPAFPLSLAAPTDPPPGQLCQLE